MLGTPNQIPLSGQQKHGANAEMWSWASHVPKNNTTAGTFFLPYQLKVMSLLRVRQIFPRKPNPRFALVLVPRSETTGCKHIWTGTNVFVNDLSAPLYKGKKKNIWGEKGVTSRQFIHLWPGLSLSGLQRYPVTPHFCLHLRYPMQLPGHDCVKIHLWYKKEGMNCAGPKSNTYSCHSCSCSYKEGGWIGKKNLLGKVHPKNSMVQWMAVAVDTWVKGQTGCWRWLTYNHMTSGSTGPRSILDRQAVCHRQNCSVVIYPKDESERALKH